jgi:hypothetical protein
MLRQIIESLGTLTSIFKKKSISKNKNQSKSLNLNSYNVRYIYIVYILYSKAINTVRRLSLFYSIHNKSAPDYLCDLMPLPVGSVSQYNLRNSNNYVLPNCRLEITKKVLLSLYYPGLEQFKSGN